MVTTTNFMAGFVPLSFTDKQEAAPLAKRNTAPFFFHSRSVEQVNDNIFVSSVYNRLTEHFQERRFFSEASNKSFTMSSPSKRREMDVMKLMMSDYEVETINDGLNEFNVFFHGPKDSLYEGGVWKLHVELPDAYPYKSPSIGFLNRIYHPNVDEVSGSVCLDVINQTWSPMFDLLNVFEVFLPQLLLYPNASDPLNGDAAALMMKDRQQYEQKVKEYCERFAKKENVLTSAAEEDVSEEEEASDGQCSSDDDEIVGHADP